MSRVKLFLAGRRVVGLPCIFFIGVLAAGGCGPRSDRLEIAGQVTLDGAPLNAGSIRFTSIGGETLIAAGAMIRDGAYLIPQEKGLLPGVYHLEIHAPDADAPPIMVSAVPGGPSIPVAPDRIPPEYNVKSEKQVDVTADGPNVFDFHIVSAPSE
jgi:hypothetical protein